MIRRRIRPLMAASWPALLSFLVATILWAAACADAPAATPAVGQFTGAYDEIVGVDGVAAPDFSDPDYVQLRLPDDIPPIYNPRFVPASEADLPGDELVIGLSIHGESRAYPAGILYSREMVNDVVGNVPVLVSWCPLCYTALVHDRRVDGDVLILGNQGALYKGGMTWYDHGTGSIWSQPLGAAIAGDRAGTELSLAPSQLTSWQQWLSTHPDTVVLSVPESGAAFRGNRPGADHVVGIVVEQSAAAWPYDSLAPGQIIEGDVAGVPVALWRDVRSGGVRAARLLLPDGSVVAPDQAPGLIRAEPGRHEIPVIIAYRSAWDRLHPGSTIHDRAAPARSDTQ